MYVTGRADGTFPGQTRAGSADAFVRKYDSAGTELWTRQFGTSSFDQGLGVSVDSSGVYVTGRAGGAFPGQTSAGSADAFVRKYDLAGNEVWTRQFGSSSFDLGRGVSVDSSGVYVAGSTSGTLPSQPNAGSGDAFVRKYDLAGTEVWTRQFGSSSSDSASGVSVDTSGVYVAGLTCGTLPGQTSAGSCDAFVRKYDSAGTEAWTRQFGSSSFDQVVGVSVDSSGVYVAGLTCGSLPGRTSSGSCDAFVAKLSENQSPTADAGGPYGVDEGGSVQLDGSGSSDPDPADTLSYEWDLDYDATTFDVDATGPSPVFDAAAIDGPDNRTVALRVTDNAGAVSNINTAVVTVANVAPTVESIIVPLDPVNINDQSLFTVDVTFSDPAGVNDEAYTCEFDLDNDGENDATVSGVSGTSCSTALAYAGPGVYTVNVTVTDKDGAFGSGNAAQFIVIYDPESGFVTGGGWIDSPLGAYTADSSLTGKANFGFVSKYKKGTTVPTGQTEFQFKAGDLNFHSTSYDWLVIAGATAMYKGEGTVNGDAGFTFQLNAIDGQISGGDGVDKFRIKIKDTGGGVIYDNQPSAGDNDDPTTALGGGSIKIHKAK